MKVFGPVPSRRLGYSLGVDTIPFKTCTLDCLYCQLGPTTAKTIQRKEYVPTAGILDDLEKKLKEGGRIDWITLSGSGEPTLHSGIGEIIKGMKNLTEIPVAVLTNGTLLGDPAVRDGLAEADLVVPSLDAGCVETFLRVNRPHQGISFEGFINGLVEFSRVFRGKVWLEVMLLAGINDGSEELGLMAPIIRRIGPELVQLNTVERPPASSEALALGEDDLNRAGHILEGLLQGIPVDVIGEFKGNKREALKSDVSELILDYLGRRPATLDDLSATLGLHKNEIIKYLGQLTRSGKVERIAEKGKQYYVILRG